MTYTCYVITALAMAVTMAMTAHAQQAQCVRQPPEAECRAYLPAWYYDTNLGTCRFRQCHNMRDSGNRFDTEEECREQCEDGSERPQQQCVTQPPEAECRARLPAWYYDTDEDTCKFRQCHNLRDSGNRFDTEEECREQCEGEESDEDEDEVEIDLCQHPSVVGPCNARIKRYFFDTSRGRCRPFYYGGCGGNENNFGSKSDCRKRCKSRRGCRRGGRGRGRGRGCRRRPKSESREDHRGHNDGGSN